MRSQRVAHCLDINYAQAPKHSLFYALDIRPRIVASCRAARLSHQSKAKYSTDSHVLHKHNGLLGRTAMITGGSSGIGYAIAERFLEEGASKIVLVGRRREKLQDAADRLAEMTPRLRNRVDHQLEGGIATRAPEEVDNESKATEIASTSSGQSVEYLVGDISVATKWMPDLEKAMANVDILVNAAGISTSNLLPRTSPDQISEMLKTNLEGAIYTSRAMLKACMRARLKERNKSNSTSTNGTVASPSPPTSLSRCIINVSSLLALKGMTGTVTYAASKAGLLGLTRSMAVEAADVLKGSNTMLRSNAILPGYIDTPMIQDFSNDQVNMLRARIPLNRFGSPREVADAAVFLSNNEYANNCVLNLDGGLSAV